MPRPWPTILSCCESWGNCGQKGTSGENSATERTADVIDVRGRLPMPVTAPAATNGIRPICDLMAVVCTLFDSPWKALSSRAQLRRYHDYFSDHAPQSLDILPLAIIKAYFEEMSSSQAES